MRRRQREIAGGEVAMMAVITKAMGAFLILMILLLPYYTGDTQSQGTVEETNQRIDEAKKGLDTAVDRLKLGRLSDPEIDELLKQLTLARDELTAAQGLIAQLRIKVDQAASQINRLEQQNDALQTQVAALQAQSAILQAEIEALKREIEKLRANDVTALQARIRELEAQAVRLRAEAAKVAPLETEVAEKSDTIEQLTTEVELLRVLAGNVDVHLISKCDEARLSADLIYNPIGVANFKPIDQFIPGIMPWKPPFNSRDKPIVIPGETYNNMITTVSLLFREKVDFFYDFFVVLRVSDRDSVTDRFYADIESNSSKNADGAINSSRGHPGCSSAMFINWQGKFERVGVFRVGPVDPVVHVKRLGFMRDNRIVYPPEDRPNIEAQIATETCGRYPSFCPLARQHARLRARGLNPWEYDRLDETIFAGPRPRPTQRPMPETAAPSTLTPDEIQRNRNSSEPRNRPPQPPAFPGP